MAGGHRLIDGDGNAVSDYLDNVDLQVLRQVAQWCADGRGVVLGTTTRTWGSAPRPPGSVVAICDDGRVVGSVSGGCIEDDLIDKAREGVLVSGKPQVVRWYRPSGSGQGIS